MKAMKAIIFLILALITASMRNINIFRRNRNILHIGMSHPQPLVTLENGAWLPVASINSISQGMPMQTPVRIEIAGVKYAVWNTGHSEWSVVSDICAHRKAPLSQGRIDPITNCIECPYHGYNLFFY